MGRAPRSFLVFEMVRANDSPQLETEDGAAGVEAEVQEEVIKILIDIESYTEVARVLKEEVWREVKIYLGLIAVGKKNGEGDKGEWDWFLKGIEGMDIGI